MRFFKMVPLAAIALAACGSPDAAEPDTPSDDAARPVASAESAPDGPRLQTPDAAGDGGDMTAPRAAGGPDTPSAGQRAPAGPNAASPAGTPEREPVQQAGKPGATDASPILERAERAYADVRSMQADFVQEVSVPLLDRTQRSAGRIYHRRPDRFLMDFSDPADDVIVADGRYLWMYYPSADPRQVLRTTLDAAGGSVDLQREFLSDATRRFDAVHLGVEQVGGRPADVLRLRPRQAAPYTQVKIWVDRGDAMVRRFEIVEQNESVRRLELRNLRPNIELRDDLFSFTPPPGAEVFDS